MFKVDINEGVLYHGDDRRREIITFDDNLRLLTAGTINKTRDLITSGKIPPASLGKNCKSCSLVDVCMPGVPDRKSSKYVDSIFKVDCEETS
jgi:CRISPR-associated exonuclease Cas4